jgi:hypothetical protein
LKIRKLNPDESAFIGMFTIAVLIVGTPVTTLVNYDTPLLHQWALNILAEKQPNVWEALLQFVIYNLQCLIMLPCISPTIKLLGKIGFQTEMPARWNQWMLSQRRVKK